MYDPLVRGTLASPPAGMEHLASRAVIFDPPYYNERMKLQKSSVLACTCGDAVRNVICLMPKETRKLAVALFLIDHRNAFSIWCDLSRIHGINEFSLYGREGASRAFINALEDWPPARRDMRRHFEVEERLRRREEQFRLEERSMDCDDPDEGSIPMR